jgi:hypothetical protein
VGAGAGAATPGNRWQPHLPYRARDGLRQRREAVLPRGRRHLHRALRRRQDADRGVGQGVDAGIHLRHRETWPDVRRR